MDRVITVLLAAAVLTPSASSLAQTDGPPQRKPGWWEMRITMAGPTPTPVHQTMRLCTDPSIEKTQSPFGVNSGTQCPKPEVTRTPTGWRISSTCAMGAMTVSTTGAASGDFDNRYHVDLVTRMRPPPTPQTGEMKIGMDAVWLGSCPAGKKPGDVEMTMNMNVAPRDPPGAN